MLGVFSVETPRGYIIRENDNGVIFINPPALNEEPCAPDGTPVSALLAQIKELQSDAQERNNTFRAIRHTLEGKELSWAAKRDRIIALMAVKL